MHITLENYGRLSARVESLSTGGFLVGLLLLWGIAGNRVARATGDLVSGVLAGSWSAMVGMLMAMTYGFSELFWGLPRLEERNVGSPDFLRSGWTDLHSFTIADVFEAGFKILLIGPIAGRAPWRARCSHRTRVLAGAKGPPTRLMRSACNVTPGGRSRW